MFTHRDLSLKLSHRRLKANLRRWVYISLALVALTCAAILNPPHTLALRAQTDTSNLVTQQIHYTMVEANEVFLVWGVDGWSNVPEAIQPIGTQIRKAVMYTPMKREGSTFSVTVQVPRDSRIDYVFQITKTRSGISIDAWDANGYEKQNFYTYARQDGVVVVEPTLALGQEVVSTLADTKLQWYAAYVLIGLSMLMFYCLVVVNSQNPFMDF
jgi:hypothetical protein